MHACTKYENPDKKNFIFSNRIADLIIKFIIIKYFSSVRGKNDFPEVSKNLGSYRSENNFVIIKNNYQNNY